MARSADFTDPTGPGTPAWNAFDNALEAYSMAAKGNHNGSNPHYHRYTNRRHDMIRLLRKHGASPETVAQWCRLLTHRCKTGEFE